MSRPAKIKFHDSSNTSSEFDNVYQYLSKTDLGSFRFIFDELNNKLFLQVKKSGDNYFSSILSIDEDGNLETTGTQTPSATIEDYGRS